jgi:probable phosphoglycerate mutase
MGAADLAQEDLAAKVQRLPLLEQTMLVDVEPFGEIILVRHGQQGENGLNDPVRDKSGDMPLSVRGQRQAAAVAAALAKQRVDEIYTSNLLRAHMTALAIASPHGLDPIVDERLREIEIYRDVRPGMTVLEEIGVDGIDRVKRLFQATRRWDSFPLSETLDEISERVNGVMERILSSQDERRRVVIVCHGAMINAIVKGVIGVTSDMFFFPAHASISRLGRGQGRLMVRSLNETSHLPVSSVDSENLFTF